MKQEDLITAVKKSMSEKYNQGELIGRLKKDETIEVFITDVAAIIKLLDDVHVRAAKTKLKLTKNTKTAVNKLAKRVFLMFFTKFHPLSL